MFTKKRLTGTPVLAPKSQCYGCAMQCIARHTAAKYELWFWSL